jgi:hypothetical protein
MVSCKSIVIQAPTSKRFKANGVLGVHIKILMRKRLEAIYVNIQDTSDGHDIAIVDLPEGLGDGVLAHSPMYDNSEIGTPCKSP